MESVPREDIPEPTPSGSKSLKQDDDLSRLMTESPLLGQVTEIVSAKLDETNENIDGFHNELQRDLDACQDQVNKLQDAKGMMENDQAATMAMIEAVKVQSKDTGRQAVEDCLDSPKMLRRILEHFSDKELIDLSLVNKLWNFEARSVLRDRGCLRAAINYESVCDSLREFASDLRGMRVVPFNGIHVQINHSKRYRNLCDSFRVSSKLPSAFQDILDRLPCKHLSVQFYQYLWESNPNCPALVLVKRILEKYCGVLEELSISYVRSEEVPFVRRLIQGRSFPCLKILKVEGMSSDVTFPKGFVKAMVSCAQNLQELHIYGEMKLNENEMEGSSAVLIVGVGLRPQRTGQICKTLIAAPRTEEIDLGCTRDGGFDVELLSTVIPMVMQASQTMLKTLQMDLLFAVPLMCYGICLENLMELTIFVDDHTVERIKPRILKLVKHFDFTRFFPKLNRVKCWGCSSRDFSSDDVSAFVERANAVLMEALPDRAINIQCLQLGSSLGKLTAMLLSEMFPYVTEISVRGISQEFPFTLIWEHFELIEQLHVDLNYPSKIENLDSVFCGIFPEEVAELRKQDDEYLKAVNIVSVMPSITRLKGLRSLIFHRNFLREGRSAAAVNEAQLLFTKVTDLLVFQRSRGLTVTLTSGTGNPKMSHMNPDWSVLVMGNPVPWYATYSDSDSYSD